MQRQNIRIRHVKCADGIGIVCVILNIEVHGPRRNLPRVHDVDRCKAIDHSSAVAGGGTIKETGIGILQLVVLKVRLYQICCLCRTIPAQAKILEIVIPVYNRFNTGVRFCRIKRRKKIVRRIPFIILDSDCICCRCFFRSIFNKPIPGFLNPFHLQRIRLIVQLQLIVQCDLLPGGRSRCPIKPGMLRRVIAHGRDSNCFSIKILKFGESKIIGITLRDRLCLRLDISIVRA